MIKNTLKQKLLAGETVYGPFMNCSYGAFTEIVGLAGFDYAIFDTEHGPLSIQTVEDLCRAAQAVGLSSIVRVKDNAAPLIQRALDIGSCGVQVPQIETAEDAQRAARAARYAPLGMRGMSLFTRAGSYVVNGTEGLTDEINAEQLVIIHVEGMTGIENLEQIAAVPGIDVIFLGPYDLSQSLGIPGQVNDPRVVGAMKGAVEIIRKAGKVAGCFAGTPEAARMWAENGVQYLSIGVDVGIFAQACKNMLTQFKG